MEILFAIAIAEKWLRVLEVSLAVINVVKLRIPLEFAWIMVRIQRVRAVCMSLCVEMKLSIRALGRNAMRGCVEAPVDANPLARVYFVMEVAVVCPVVEMEF